MTEATLRERSRVKRRAAIEQAALRLFATQGYDQTTIAQVAAEAEVAPRTVSMYFTSKLHLALSYTTAAAQRLEQAIESRDDGSQTLDVVTAWLRSEFADHGDQMDLTAAMLRANPEIRGAETAELTNAKQAVTSALATDLGRDPFDPVVAVAGGAFAGVIDVLIQLGQDGSASSGEFSAAVKMLRAVMKAAKTAT